MFFKSLNGVILGVTFFIAYNVTTNCRNRILQFPDFTFELNHIYEQESTTRVSTKDHYQIIITEDATVEAQKAQTIRCNQ